MKIKKRIIKTVWSGYDESWDIYQIQYRIFGVWIGFLGKDTLEEAIQKAEGKPKPKTEVFWEGEIQV